MAQDSMDGLPITHVRQALSHELTESRNCHNAPAIGQKLRQSNFRGPPDQFLRALFPSANIHESGKNNRIMQIRFWISLANCLTVLCRKSRRAQDRINRSRWEIRPQRF